MPNAVKWITNVGKSIGYSAIDQMKELNPTVTAFIDDNGDFGKSLYNTVKFKSLKESGNKLSENQYFKLAKDTIDNLKEDIRTGKLYNKEREEKAMDSAVNEYLGFDDSDFGFDDGDIDFGFDDDSDDIDEATKSINRTADIVGEKSSMAISKALVGSSEFIVKSNRQNTKTLFDQNNILYSKIHTDMSNINTNIGSIIEFAKDAAVPHFNNSSTFYTTMTSKIEETNSLLKELVDIQKELYNKKEEYGSSNGRKFSDITGAQGTPIIQSYIDMVKGNIKNNSYLDLLNMGMEMGVGASISSNPGKFITDFLVKAITPKMIKESMKDFNESLSGVFANIMLKLSTGDGLISEIFGIDNTLKTRLSPSQYNKGAVPFDGITRKSITEVIPTYLAKILAAVSNQRETRYDYANGKFVTMDEILQRTRDITNDNARYAFSDIRYKMMDNASRYDFDEKDNGKFITKKQFEKNLNEFFLYQYKNGKVFSDRKGNLDASTYGLSGGAKAEISAKIIQDMWKSLPKKDKLNVAKEILSRRESQTSDMLRREREGDAVELAIFNESVKAFKGDKNKSNYDPLQVATKYNSSILNVLVDIRKEVSYIRQYGFKQGRKKLRGKGKTSSTFDKFVPYEIEKDDIYDDDLGNFSSYDVVKRKEDEEIDKYLEETASEIRQEKARQERIKKQEKKGPVEAFLSIFTNNKTVKDTAESIDNVLLSPAKFIKSVLDKADNAMYDLVFGREGDNDPNHAGILKKFGEGIKNTFDNINIWLNENIFNPLKEKFTKENIKGAVKKFFGIFGVDIEAIGNKVKQTLFGIKDAEGKRIKDGMFGGFVDSVKKDFSDVFGWGKKTVKDAVNATGVKGELNEKGKAKEERKNKASDMIKKLQEEKKKLDEATKSNIPPVEGQAATGFKRVPKTGVYALSEGEAVIPPDYNPANIRKRYRNEQKAIDNYKKHGGINMLGEGSDQDVSKEAQKGWKDKKGSKYNDIDARIAKLQEIKNRKYDREDYEDLPLYYKMADQARALGQFTKGFFGDIFDKVGNVDESKVKTNVTEMTDRLLGSAKEHLPEITTGAILGAGTSLITGMIGGPLLGAAVGSAVGLTIKSEEVQKLLFGNYDEDSKEYKGGLLPSKVSKAINKYAPTMAKGGTLGAITAIMPFVPGGPIAGLLVGSAAGFAIKNDKIQDYLFGEQGKLKGLPEKLKSALPKMGLGAIAGLAVGPFGVATNMILGSAIGFATDTNKFKDIFFGEEDKNGNRHGGIYDRIVSAVTKPVKNFLKENADYFTKWFQETIKKNVIDFFNPVKRRLRDLGKSIVNIFDRMGKKFTTALKESVLNRFFGVIEKFINPLNTLYKGLRGLVTGTVGLPFKLIGNIGRRMQASDVRRGKADYLKTAEERLDYRKNNKVSKLFRKDKALGTDKAINDMSSDEIDLMLKSVKTLKDGGKSAESQYRETRNKLSTDILRSNLNRDDKRNIVELLKNNDFDGIRQYVSNPNIGINNTNKAYINSLLDSSEQQIKNSKFVMDKFKNGEERSALESLLKERGIDVKNIKLDDVEKYLSNELEARKGKEEENKDKVEKDEAKQWRNDLYDRIKEANDSLLHIANFLDPKFKGSEEQQKQLENYQMGKAADKARQTNYEERDRKDLSDEDKKENEQRRLDAANITDEAKTEKRRDKLNDKAEKQKDKRDFEDAKKVDPSIGVNPLKRAMMIVDDFKDSVREGKKYFLDELNGYNDNENISKFGRIKKLFKQEIFGESVETQFYNGMPIKMYRDQAGNIQPDKSDSETVQTLKERDEDRETQKGILSNLKDIPSKIGEFLGFGKDKGEKKENLLSKIMNTAFKAALVTAGVGIFVKKIWPIVKKPLVEFKDGLLEGLFGKSDGKGGLANTIGEKIGEGIAKLKNILVEDVIPGFVGAVKDGIPVIMNGIEALAGKVVPFLLETFISNIPGILGGIFRGFRKLGGWIKDAIFHRKSSDSENAFNYNDTFGGIKSISPSGDTGGYKPSSAWNITGKTWTSGIDGDIKIDTLDDQGNEIQDIQTTMLDEKTTSKDTLDAIEKTKSGESKGPKAYIETANNRLNKNKEAIDKILDNNITIKNQDTGETKNTTVYDLLNDSETVVAYAPYENDDGSITKVAVTGSELLNYPDQAEDILGINTKLSRADKEKAAKEYGYTGGDDLSNPTTTDYWHRILRSSASQFFTGKNYVSTFLNNRANAQFVKATTKAADGRVLTAGFNATKGSIYKLGSKITGFSKDLGNTILPESLIGSERKMQSLLQNVNKKATEEATKASDSAIVKFATKLKDLIKRFFNESSLGKKIKELLGKGTEKELSKGGEQVAEELGEKFVAEASKDSTKVAKMTLGGIPVIDVLFSLLAFDEGFDNAPNIAHILADSCTLSVRILCGITNALYSLLTSKIPVVGPFIAIFLPVDIILEVIIKIFNKLTESDVLNLQKLQDEADREISKMANKKGSDYSLEDYNKEYDDKVDQFNAAYAQGQMYLGNDTDAVNKYIEDYISEDNNVAQRQLDKKKKSDADKKAANRKLIDDKYQEYIKLYPKWANMDKEEAYRKIAVDMQLVDQYAGGTPYIPRTGLYALSKGEYVGRIPMLAEGTVGYNSILNNIKDNTQLSTTDVENTIQKMYDYANTGDNRLFTSYENATNSTIKMLNNIGKKVFAPVYAIQKMQSYMQDTFQNKSGNGLRIYESFEKELDNTNSYLNDTASMKEYWNNSLKNNDTLYGTMTDVMTTMHKVLMYPVIMSRKMFESMADALGSPLNMDNNTNTSNNSTSSETSSTIDSTTTTDVTASTDDSSTTTSTTSGSTSKTTSSGYTTSITGFNKTIDNIIINPSGIPLIYYKDDNGKIQVYKKDKYATRYVNSIAYTSDGRVVLKYSDRSVIVTSFKDPKKIPGLLNSVIYKYSNKSTSKSFGDWLKGKANAQQQYLANQAQKKAGSGSGLYIGRGTYDLPETIGPVSTGLSKQFKYTETPNIKPLSDRELSNIRFNNITSTGDNFVSQVGGTTSNMKFNTSLDSTLQKVSDSGCAPAVATMVINSIRGKSTIDMNTAVKDALPYKVPNSGVSSSYFDDEFNKYGISTDYIENTNYDNINKSPIIRAIKENRPTILLGQDPSNSNKNTSPFGNNSHYVVADSISNDNKYIYIDDPESRKPRIKYLLKDVLPKVKVGITTYIGNKLRKVSNKLKMYIGGAKNQVKAPAGDYIGKNTKQFESGNKGPTCIVHCGNDGGLSYGSYQMIWSGSAKDFWNKYFSSKYGTPTSYNDLKEKWLQAVKDIGEDAFFAKEWEYILDSHYKPAVEKLKAKGFNPNTYSRAIQDCIWSWAVHRGASGCASEFGDVISKLGNPSEVDETTLINTCYDVRGNYMKKVGWSDIANNRYGTGPSSERAVILALVGKDPIDYTAPNGLSTSSSLETASETSIIGSNTNGTEYRSILDILLAPFDTLGSQYGLTGGTQTTSGGTTTYNVDGISGPVSSDPSIAEKQVKVVAQMNSVYGKLKYAQDNAKYPGSRNPDDGSGDCSSTVQWAYNKALGVDVGSWSGDQAASSNTYLVDGGRNGAGKTDESKLQLGDILLYGTDAGAHAEMYFGNGKVLTHGNPDKLGPTTANINRRSDYWGTKRLNEFKSSGTTNFNSSSNNTTSTSNNKTTLKDSFSKIGSAIFNKAKDTLKKNTGSGSGLYVGSGSFVSQLDPKYANMKFNIPGDTQNQTIGDSGCAPAAATMVLNDIYGNGSGMLDSAKLALKYKQNNDGVSSDYFQDIYSRNGLNANYYDRKEQVANDLRQGKDVVLLGSDKKNTSKNNSPFGPNPHYVVASGMSKDGKSITIKDPESKSPKKYNTKKILDNTKLGIGYGSALNSIKSKLRKYIGRGIGKFSGILYVGDSRTDAMKDCISEDGVYFIAKVSAGLEWLKGEASTQVKSKIQSDPNLAVVFNFGVNDLYRKAEYVNWYTQFEKENPNANIFFMSVNPVDNDPYASDTEVQKFNDTMKSHFGNRYLDVYSYLKSTGYKTVDGLHYDNATSKKIHEKVKEMLGGINISTSTSTGATTSSEGTSVLDRLLSGVDNLAVKYGLMVPVSTGNTTTTTTSNNTTSVGPGSTYPTYTLTDSQLNDVATCITGETGGDDMYASMEEASQMANLNEVTYGRSNTGDDLYKTLHGGWYASASWTRGVTDTAKQAAISVLKEGKRTLPRYVTEHDTFPLDIENPKSRSEYKLGDPVKNQYGSNYKFYKFFGKNGDGDISGYFQKDYDKYSGDTPWSVGSGSGLLNNDNTLKYNYNVGKGSGQDVLAALSKYDIGSSLTSVTGDTTSSTSNKDTISLLKSIIKLLAQIVDNTKDVSEIVEILSKIVSIQADSNKKDMQQDLSSLRSQLANKLNSYNKSNAGSGDLSYLMDSIETLAME